MQDRRWNCRILREAEEGAGRARMAMACIAHIGIRYGGVV